MIMYLYNTLLIIVLILFCNTSMYPQDIDQVSNQDQINLELHDISSKYKILKHNHSCFMCVANILRQENE